MNFFSTPKPTAPYPIPGKLLDFRVFLILIWRHLGLPDPTPGQMEMAYYMQHGPRRKVIQAFRGMGKSWIAATFVVWVLFLWPDLKTLVVSASKERADNFTIFAMRLIKEVPILAPLIPGDGQRDSRISFDVGPAQPDQAPSVKSVGIFGQLSGSRADIIIPDDVEVSNNALTQGMRDKLSEAIKEFDAILKPDGVITYLGTPQTEQSIYNLLPARGYETRIWPARYPNEKEVAHYGSSLAPRIKEGLARGAVVGTTTDPRRFDDDDLRQRELSYGRAGFALQFMLDTSLSDAERFPLRLSDLIVMNLNKTLAPESIAWGASPQNMWDSEELPCVGLKGDRYYRPAYISQDVWLPYTGGGYMGIDPSGRGKDETAFAVVKQLNGTLYCMKCTGLLGGYDKNTLIKLAECARDFGVDVIRIESNFGDGMFTELFTPILFRYHRCRVEEVRHNKQKELRIIDTLEPLISGHKLVIDKQVVYDDFYDTPQLHLGDENHHRYQLMYQMANLTRERGSLSHDDRLDVLAMTCAAWVEQVAQDQDDKVQERKRNLLRAELASWEEGVIGGLGTRFMGGTPKEVIEHMGFANPFSEGHQRVLIIGEGDKAHNRQFINPSDDDDIHETWYDNVGMLGR